jgi:hypothetical protein
VGESEDAARADPIWTDQIGNVALTLVQLTQGSRTSYQLFAVAGEGWLQAGAYWHYAEALAAIRSWQEYLRGGGIVEAWGRQSLPQ